LAAPVLFFTTEHTKINRGHKMVLILISVVDHKKNFVRIVKIVKILSSFSGENQSLL